MRVELDFEKTVEQNAELLFNQAKKIKKKLTGLSVATTELQKQLEKEKAKAVQSVPKPAVKKRVRDWFEKFRWCCTSDGLLVIGGRDATTNDMIVKKFLDSGDLYFHADIVGAPHCVLKTKSNQATEQSKKEAAQFATVFSRAWQSGVASADAYSVLPTQVSKQAPSGEALGRGAFMIYGEREWFKKIPLACGIGFEKNNDDFRVISGPLSAVKKQALHFVELVPGNEEKSAVAKKIFRFFLFKTKNRLGSVTLDDVLAALPTGEGKIKSQS